jgi:hypothetical protein
LLDLVAGNGSAQERDHGNAVFHFHI